MQKKEWRYSDGSAMCSFGQVYASKLGQEFLAGNLNPDEVMRKMREVSGSSGSDNDRKFAYIANMVAAHAKKGDLEQYVSCQGDFCLRGRGVRLNDPGLERVLSKSGRTFRDLIKK